jgi:hypothetical protein
MLVKIKIMIDTLRETKVNFLATEVAVFDLSLTLVGSYYVAKKLGVENALIWSPLLGIAGGYFFHKLFEVETPLTTKIDSFIAPSTPVQPHSTLVPVIEKPPKTEPEPKLPEPQSPKPIEIVLPPTTGGVIPSFGLTLPNQTPSGWGMRGGMPSPDFGGRPYWVDLAEQLGIETESVVPAIGEFLMGLL